MREFFISPSTQGANRYANGTDERTQMNLVADILCKELDRHGIEYARNDRNKDYSAAISASNAYKPQYHVAIHSNAGDGTARGCEVFCFDPTNKSSKGTQLAQKVYARLSAITPTSDRGIKSGVGHLSEVTKTNAPAILGEVDFHDKLDGAVWICSHIPEIAHAYLLGMLEQIGKSYIPVAPPVVFPTPSALATGIVVGGSYKIVTHGYEGSDGKGKRVDVASIPAKCLKISAGSKYPYGMDYNGDGWVDAWFDADSIV